MCSKLPFLTVFNYPRTELTGSEPPHIQSG
jgi:hypothetical protein